ncbi:SDR family oxidoreductase [Fictibacillus sp. WQ 8-8]|uniref:SDR family NAD(P)-dependent oxidoreductase n=1 Tax=Fictibacillus sp. WQ 8-8 TaxID=2938788 RepID=UPI0021092034|nr:SDR family oxidoreductase [Fictibacillus sp. WQ 8-8]MCQ6268126.1 SDR family oxidoreductase [Fictibacillus sp. WQ 8-8]
MTEKNVFITGAGGGIGKETALLFAEHGATVFLNDLPDSKGVYEVQSIIEDRGGRCELKLGDISSSIEVRNMFKDIERLDVLVNNGGILQESSFLEIEDEDWDRMMKVHLYGTFYCAREALRIMMKSKCGRIINISSDLGQIGCENLAHYSAAKGGIIALTKSLAREFSSQGILVNSVAPGGTLTPMVTALGENYIKEEAARYPIQRLATPCEIAEAIFFLSTESASFITGQVLGVNGGGVMNG